MCDTKILSQKGDAVISQCTECRAVFIWHHNLILNFTEVQFGDFSRFANGLILGNRSLPFPDGQKRAVLCTPHHD